MQSPTNALPANELVGLWKLRFTMGMFIPDTVWADTARQESYFQFENNGVAIHRLENHFPKDTSIIHTHYYEVDSVTTSFGTHKLLILDADTLYYSVVKNRLMIDDGAVEYLHTYWDYIDGPN